MRDFAAGSFYVIPETARTLIAKPSCLTWEKKRPEQGFGQEWITKSQKDTTFVAVLEKEGGDKEKMLLPRGDIKVTIFSVAVRGRKNVKSPTFWKRRPQIVDRWDYLWFKNNDLLYMVQNIFHQFAFLIKSQKSEIRCLSRLKPLTYADESLQFLIKICILKRPDVSAV